MGENNYERRKEKKMDNLNTRAQMVPLLSVGGDFFLAEQVPVRSTTTAGRVLPAEWKLPPKHNLFDIHQQKKKKIENISPDISSSSSSSSTTTTTTANNELFCLVN